MRGNGSVKKSGRGTARMALKALSQAALTAVVLSMAACGGGSEFGNGTPDVVSTPTAAGAEITGITAPSGTTFGAETEFVITGKGLTNASVSDVDGNCDVIPESVKANDAGTSVTFKCVPTWYSLSFVAVNESKAPSSSVDFAMPNPQVTIHTKSPAGVESDIVVELDPQKAPETVRNFLTYVYEEFYTDTIFHRILNATGGTQVVQGGERNLDNSIKPATHPAIPLESQGGLSNTAGTIAMARASGADTATTSFFFNVEDNSSAYDYKSVASPGYAAFGHIVGADGLALVKAIRDAGPHDSTVPTPTQVTSIEITRY